MGVDAVEARRDIGAGGIVDGDIAVAEIVPLETEAGRSDNRRIVDEDVAADILVRMPA